MIVYKCDKCRREGEIRDLNEVEVRGKRAHLCDGCLGGLIHWLGWTS